MAEGFCFMPLGWEPFRSVNGLLRCNINTGVHARAGGANVSLRDVTMAQMEKGATQCEWRHAPEARGGFGDFEKVQWVELRPASGEDGWLSLARGGPGQVSHEMEGWWKSQNRKNMYISPYVEEPLNSKVIKSFVPELRSRKCFRVSRFLYSVYICYTYMDIVCPFRVAISVSGYGTDKPCGRIKKII